MLRDPFALLRDHERIGAVITTKAEGGPFDEARLAKELHCSASAGLRQVHGPTTVIVRETTARTVEADGLITDVPGLMLTIRWADCQNFLVFAPDRRVVGLIHCGWKGLLAGVIPEFFAVLERTFGIGGSETLVCAGPSLCKSCSEFSDPRRELPGIDERFFDGRYVDLRAAAEEQLRRAGVLMHRFERMQVCTRCDPKAYWSYRGGDKDAVADGCVNALCCVLR